MTNTRLMKIMYTGWNKLLDSNAMIKLGKYDLKKLDLNLKS